MKTKTVKIKMNKSGQWLEIGRRGRALYTIIPPCFGKTENLTPSDCAAALEQRVYGRQVVCVVVA